jgi:carotenoid cleavage dioxygenase-like enzyme
MHGHLMSMTETMFWNIHDPYTLETIGQMDIKKSKNYPDGFFCVTQTAHPHFDLKTGDLYNILGCMQFPRGSEDLLVPKVAYLPFTLRIRCKMRLFEL